VIFASKSEEDSITCSILEIYNEKLIDLFDPLKQSVDGIKMKEINDSVVLEGLVEVRVDVTRWAHRPWFRRRDR
jgi:hypothetical protein